MIPIVPPEDEKNDDLVFVHWGNPRTPGPASRALASKKFRCLDEDCDKTFSRESDMLRHWGSHRSGPKAYDCPANRCPRTGMKGFWRSDKLKAHLDSKHPEIEVERWFLRVRGLGGFRDVAKREEHEAMMRSKGYTLVGDFPKGRVVYALSEEVDWIKGGAL
ncbi:MAG: hypothetical protein Q9210_006256 [Variospora velana]